MSSIRSYSKHEASYLFRLQDLDLVGLAQSFGLLKMPKMPELKGKEKDVEARWTDAEIDVSLPNESERNAGSREQRDERADDSRVLIVFFR